jgi:hypothetical protein
LSKKGTNTSINWYSLSGMLYCKTFNSIQAGNVAQQYGLVLALHVQGPGLLPATTKNLNIHIGMEMKKVFNEQ